MNPGTCVHFTGLRFGKEFEHCKAGIRYRTTFGSEPGIFLRMPCVESSRSPKTGESKPMDGQDQTMMACALRQFPTAEQVAVADLEMKATTAKTVAAIKVAGAWRVTPKPAIDRHETVECPVCKGNLHLQQSAYNGHVHGYCETEGCVRWME